MSKYVRACVCRFVYKRLKHVSIMKINDPLQSSIISVYIFGLFSVIGMNMEIVNRWYIWFCIVLMQLLNTLYDTNIFEYDNDFDVVSNVFTQID